MTPERKKKIREDAIQIKGMFSGSEGIKEINNFVIILCNLIIELTD